MFFRLCNINVLNTDILINRSRILKDIYMYKIQIEKYLGFFLQKIPFLNNFSVVRRLALHLCFLAFYDEMKLRSSRLKEIYIKEKVKTARLGNFFPQKYANLLVIFLIF